MITVANRTETAARIKYSFEHNRFATEESCNPDYLIHIESKTLEKAEAESVDLAGLPVEDADDSEGEGADNVRRKFSKKEQAVILRETVDTVGQIGRLGEQIRNVISDVIVPIILGEEYKL